MALINQRRSIKSMRKSTIRRNYQWNDAVYKNSQYVDPSTDAVYDLSHMDPMYISLPYEYKDELNEKVKGVINAKVTFDPHCYTSEITTNDTRPTLITDNYNDGSQIKRGLDSKRYEYSKYLRLVISNLSHKICRESTTRGKAIRLEQQDRQNPRKGIYILLKTKLNQKNNELEIFVETAHYRNNEPFEADLKKIPKKYMLILGDMIKPQK